MVSQPYVISQWTTVDLSPLGNAASLQFTLASSDTGAFGINTPTYFALDNLALTPVPEPGTLVLIGLARRRPDVRRCRRGLGTPIMGDMSVLDLIGRTPLVRLDRIAAGLPVPVYGKCEHLNPGGSVKDRIALAIVDDAESRTAC